MTVFRSHHPDLELPDRTVTGLIAEAAVDNADRVAVVDAESGATMTYAALQREVERTSVGLRSKGVGRGGVVAIVAPNSLDWLVAALGVMTAGGAVTGANPAYLVDELTHQLHDSGARWVITNPANLDTVRAAARAAGCVGDTWVTGGSATAPPGDPGVAPFESVSTPTASDPGIRPGEAPRPGDLCALPYSSGTTGRSKGVRLTHRTLSANIRQVAAVAPVQAGDPVLAFLPMFHIMGFAVVTLGALVQGATVVTLPGFEPRAFLGALQRHRVRSLFVVPPIANFLAASPLVDEFDLSTVHTIGCGAAPLGAATEQRIRARLGCRVAQGYGMTESSGCISYPQFDDPAATGSSGGLLPGTEALIVDPRTGEPQPAGVTGEVWFRGPQVFEGYLHNPAATADTIDADGWVHTGDLGHVDEIGYLHITDRLKELIKVKGFQVAPAELEAVLSTHPGVGDVAVIGRPDDRAGERPIAFVVPATGTPGDELRHNVGAELMEWFAARSAPHKHLAEVVVMDAIPRNPSGKILRRILRDGDAGGPSGTGMQAGPPGRRRCG